MRSSMVTIVYGVAAAFSDVASISVAVGAAAGSAQPDKIAPRMANPPRTCQLPLTIPVRTTSPGPSKMALPLAQPTRCQPAGARCKEELTAPQPKFPARCLLQV